MNRRVARLKGFRYLRIVPISREANSSSGGLSEKWAVAYHGTPDMVATNKRLGTLIQYADLADIVKMLNIKTGGSFKLNNIPCDSYDVKLIDEDGDQCVVGGVDLCAQSDHWVITSDELVACQKKSGN